MRNRNSPWSSIAFAASWTFFVLMMISIALYSRPAKAGFVTGLVVGSMLADDATTTNIAVNAPPCLMDLHSAQTAGRTYTLNLTLIDMLEYVPPRTLKGIWSADQVVPGYTRLHTVTGTDARIAETIDAIKARLAECQGKR